MRGVYFERQSLELNEKTKELRILSPAFDSKAFGLETLKRDIGPYSKAETRHVTCNCLLNISKETWVDGIIWRPRLPG